jgi:hypothetical protein
MSAVVLARRRSKRSMTATKIELHDFVEQLRSTVPYVHPAGRATIDAWLSDMHDAADHGDAVTVARLARCISNKIEQELAWQRS